jgi:hypothetical protein
LRVHLYDDRLECFQGSTAILTLRRGRAQPRADHDGSLAAFLKPELTPSERTVAQVEGWILGVAGNLRAV